MQLPQVLTETFGTRLGNTWSSGMLRHTEACGSSSFLSPWVPKGSQLEPRNWKPSHWIHLQMRHAPKHAPETQLLLPFSTLCPGKNHRLWTFTAQGVLFWSKRLAKHAKHIRWAEDFAGFDARLGPLRCSTPNLWQDMLKTNRGPHGF